MRRRAVIMVASLWAFLAVPNLCLFGLLSHACGNHASDGCGHESDCHDDPCAKFTSGNATPLRGMSLDSLQPPLAVTLIDALADDVLPTQHVSPQPHPPRVSTPAPGSCLPLLI